MGSRQVQASPNQRRSSGDVLGLGDSPMSWHSLSAFSGSVGACATAIPDPRDATSAPARIHVVPHARSITRES
jgi:hypothetical protein